MSESYTIVGWRVFDQQYIHKVSMLEHEEKKVALGNPE